MHHHNHFLHFLHNRELNELYASIALRSFALSMIGIFIPIYLLQEGYSLASVLIFFAVVTGIHAFGVFPAAKFSSRFDLSLNHKQVISWVFKDFFHNPFFYGFFRVRYVSRPCFHILKRHKGFFSFLASKISLVCFFPKPGRSSI